MCPLWNRVEMEDRVGKRFRIRVRVRVEAYFFVEF